jgi:hypothetical protein
MRTSILAGLTLISIITAVPVSAFERLFCSTGQAVDWKADTLHFRLENTLTGRDFDSNSTWTPPLRSAMLKWNNVSGSNLNITTEYGTTGQFPSLGNNVNDIQWTSLDPGVLGLTESIDSCFFGSMVEVDISFASGKTFATYTVSMTGGSPSLEATAIHELGHGFGLGHEDDVLSVMFPTAPFGSVGQNDQAEPFPDDREGARYFHPDATTSVDIGVSAWNRVVRPTGWPPVDTVFQEPITSPTSVTRGSSLSFKLTLMNLGTEGRTVSMIYLLSPTRDIKGAVAAGSARLLGSIMVTMLRGSTRTLSLSPQVPSNTPTGKYYIGGYVNPTALGDATPSNNYVDLATVIEVK